MKNIQEDPNPKWRFDDELRICFNEMAFEAIEAPY